MSNLSKVTTRYSEVDLAEFKEKIEQKLASSEQQIALFENRIDDISDTKGNDGDWMDDSSNTQDLEMLYSMVSRQKKHINDLKNALIRIGNKSYGICVVTGELIDKRRLLAVLTTTKSLNAKMIIPTKAERLKDDEAPKVKPKTERTIISKVIKRTGGTPVVSPPKEDASFFSDDDDDDNFDDDLINDIDLEEIAGDPDDLEND